jgi:hypothetical protein
MEEIEKFLLVLSEWDSDPRSWHKNKMTFKGYGLNYFRRRALPLGCNRCTTATIPYATCDYQWDLRVPVVDRILTDIFSSRIRKTVLDLKIEKYSKLAFSYTSVQI